MTKKEKSIFIGYYYPREENDNSLIFVYEKSSNYEKLEKYFRNVVYKSEYGQVLEGDDADVDIMELQKVFDYKSKKFYGVKIGKVIKNL